MSKMLNRWVAVSQDIAKKGNSVNGYRILMVSETIKHVGQLSRCRTIPNRQLSSGDYLYCKISIPECRAL